MPKNKNYIDRLQSVNSLLHFFYLKCSLTGSDFFSIEFSTSAVQLIVAVHKTTIPGHLSTHSSRLELMYSFTAELMISVIDCIINIST